MMTRRDGWRSDFASLVKLLGWIVGFFRFLVGLPGLVVATARRTMAVNVPALAAAIAFHALLSLAPLLLLVLAAASSLLGSQAARARLLEAIEALGDPAVAAPLRTIVEMVVDVRGNALATAAGVLLMIYFASAVFHELATALDRVWDVPPRAGIGGMLVQRLISLVLVPAAVAGGMLLMALNFLLALVAPIVVHLAPNDARGTAIYRGVVPFLLMAVMLTLVYRYGPRGAPRWRDVWLGASLAALAFTAGNAVLATMLRRNLLATLYGAAGALVLVLLWIFYSAHILLIGACFTREYADRFGSRARPAAPRPGAGLDSRRATGVASRPQ